MIRLFNTLMYHTYVAVSELVIAKVGQKKMFMTSCLLFEFKFWEQSYEIKIKSVLCWPTHELNIYIVCFCEM